MRIRHCGKKPPAANGEFVLYWMTTARRLESSFSLQRAIDWCVHLQKPLLILEPIDCRARWNNDRLHAFVLDGMRDLQQECEQKSIAYLPYVEPKPSAAKEVFRKLAARAAVIVTDDFPCYFVPAMIASMGRQSPVLVEAVDGNGLWPMRATEQVFLSAYAFRRFLQKNLRPHLEEFPVANPFARKSLAPLSERIWRDVQSIAKPADEKLLAGAAAALAALPIDHSVGRAAFDGGPTAAEKTLDRFLKQRLGRYAEHRNDPDDEAASGLSPYLHFGHIGVHQIFLAVARQENWSPAKLGQSTSGSKAGWWGLSADAESFLDELVTWRELGFNFCSQREDYDHYDSLPEWARATLKKHADDPRPVTYTAQQLEAAETYDEIWNAAQRQLVREGRMHNYLRMLWGKKVLEWSPTPEAALEILIDLNNKYAVDGRDPNSYSGILWIFGRYDRPWGPERPIFGTIRYMSSQNTAKKLPLKEYLRRYASRDGEAAAGKRSRSLFAD
jgi:deoxyribodipyrimidine photo-lyase